jgi:hypothetical protein
MKRAISTISGLVVGLGITCGAGADLVLAKEGGFWQGIYERIFRREPPIPPSAGGSRPLFSDGFCSVVPGPWKREDAVMLRSRPVLMWKGDVAALQLKALPSEQVVWEQSVNLKPGTDGLTRMLYPGPALVRGEGYRLVIRKRSGSEVYSNFQLLGGEKRSRLMGQLGQLRDQAWQEGKRGYELMGLQVDFLNKQGLWLEGMQDILQSDDGSLEWRKMQAGLVGEVCK